MRITATAVDRTDYGGAGWSGRVSCRPVSGEADWLLHMAVPDLPACEHFLFGTRLMLPGICDIRSNSTIATIKAQTALPHAHLGAGGG